MTASTEPRPGPHGAAPVTGCRTSANRKGNHHAPTVGSLALAGNQRYGPHLRASDPASGVCRHVWAWHPRTCVCLETTAQQHRQLCSDLWSGNSHLEQSFQKMNADEKLWIGSHGMSSHTPHSGEAGVTQKVARVHQPRGSGHPSTSPMCSPTVRGGLTKQPDNK